MFLFCLSAIDVESLVYRMKARPLNPVILIVVGNLISSFNSNPHRSSSSKKAHLLPGGHMVIAPLVPSLKY